MSTQRSLLAALRILAPLVPSSEKKRFWGLLSLTVIMSVIQLSITGLVALLATVFGSLESALNSQPLLWIRSNLGVEFVTDARYLALAILSCILLIIFFKNSLTIVHQWGMAAFSEAIGNAARVRLIKFYLRAPFLLVQQQGPTEMLFGLSSAAFLGKTLLTILQIFSHGLLITTIFFALVAVSPLPSLAFLTVLGIGSWLIVRITRNILAHRSNRVFQTDLETHRIQQSAVYGLKELRLYGREKIFADSYAANLNKALQAKKSFQALGRLPVGSLETLGFASLIGVMLFLIFVQHATIGTISAIMGFMAAAAWRVLPVANRMVDLLTEVRSYMPYISKTAELIQFESEIQAQMPPSLENTSKPIPFSRSICMAGVSFRYPDTHTYALENVNLTIESGKMIGIIGLSGSGKSTLVNILTGLIPPESGQLMVDDALVTKDNAHAWLQRIGYVSQFPYIMNASLAENVAFSRWGEKIDEDRVLACCRMAALDFIDDLENGIQTMLGENGTGLSGGQAQRVAIARALYSEPDLIVFDEATSALDIKNEKAIYETMLSLKKRVTVIIIAHRLSTVEGCDTIVWLNKGQIHALGSVNDVLPLYTTTLKEK